MQAFTVVLVRLIDTWCERLRKSINGTDVIDIAPFDKDGNSGKILYQVCFAETLKEIKDTCMRFVFAKNRQRHSTRSVKM